MFTTRWLRDVAERTVATYVETLLGLLIASEWANLDLAVVTTAAVSAIPAALAVAKGALARLRGDDESAAMTLAPLRTEEG